MQPAITGFLAVACSLTYACSPKQSKPKDHKTYCACDSLNTVGVINSKVFNSIPEFDTSTFDMTKFFIDDSINRVLWYRDIENKGPTRFTPLWNDYYPAAYHASDSDFGKFYHDKKGIELAVQLGPNMDLWAYHIFVFKKMGCCYLVTRSYFRHARFTYKAYAIINEVMMDSLYIILSKIYTLPLSSKQDFHYVGYFVDNRFRKSFYVDLENVVSPPMIRSKPKQEVQEFYDFVDKGIPWKMTYRL